MLDDVVMLNASELSVAIRERKLSCVEVMNAYLDHIDRINPTVNAIVSMRPCEDLLREAAEKDALLAAGHYRGWMHGFPHAVKDFADAKGFKTTMGFFRGAFDVPPATADAIGVSRIKDAGAIIIGKTNIPEFGLGSHTYNQVFGITHNAYRNELTAGGSSGGAAVALALRLVPVADGSDFMGSLRNPAGWNNVLGLRPSFGRVPANSNEVFLCDGAVEGPMARTVADLALLLDTMSGYDPRAPRSLPDEPTSFAQNLDRDFRSVKVAWLGDLGGYLPMQPGVLEMCESALQNMTALGMSVEPLPGLPRAGGFNGNDALWPLWLTFRHWQVGSALKPLLRFPEVAGALSPQARYEIDGLLKGPTGQGPISAGDLHSASIKRTAMYHAFLTVFANYEYVALPTAQVFPFPVEMHWPTEINGTAMSSYHRWMEVTAIATLLGVPAISLPAGFSPAGLPMGLQILAGPRRERKLLQLAHAWEQQTPWGAKMLPPALRWSGEQP